jgi:hypothetical protein
MSLNYLLHRHQVSLMRAQAAPSVDVRRAHERFAAGYADRIADMVEPAGATTARLTRA